ncbi:MAG: hypothetical protein IJW16_06125 [Clostridia bacterium]|nr:hypothetical protein [Clostridia bacterium]
MKKLLIVLLALTAIVCTVSCNGGAGDGAYTFTVNGQKLAIDAKAQETLNAVGAPISSQELGTCGIGDKDKLFIYADFRVMTYQMEGVDYFYQIELLTDLVSTEEGIAIGATEQAVIDAYGEPDTRDVSAFTYAAKGMKLVLHFGAESTVKSIVYMRAE